MDNEPTVRTLMSSPAVTVTERTPLDEAQQQMETHQIRHLPVVSSDGKLIGMISDRNLIAHGRKGERQTLRVVDVMQRKVVTIAADRFAREAARELASEKIGALPVVEGDQLVGIITSSDFLALAAGSLPLWSHAGGNSRSLPGPKPLR